MTFQRLMRVGIDIPRDETTHDAFIHSLRLLQHDDFCVMTTMQDDGVLIIEADHWDEITRFVATLKYLIAYTLSGQSVLVCIPSHNIEIECPTLREVVKVVLRR